MIYQLIPVPPRRTVMVIASDQANLLLLTQLIARRDDWELLTATLGKWGVDMASACQPDIVVMDTGLSDISGLEALKMLRGNPSTSHIPVIALSSDAHRSHVDQGLKAGFFRYLTKPFKLTDLLDAIDDALQLEPKSVDPLLSPSVSGVGG